MAFPGERAIKQFPRGTIDLFEGIVLYEGEICIVLADDGDDPLETMEIRVGDGETAGGIPFVTKAYVDAQVGGEGLSEGNDALALEGLDTEQRSWPATAFGLFAPKNNAVLSGTPTVQSHPIGTDSSLRLASTGFVASNFKKLGYTGSNRDEINFPIGHLIAADINGNSTDRNATPAAVLRLDSDNNTSYKLGGVGTALAGTWRSRGRITIAGGINHILMERVA